MEENMVIQDGGEYGMLIPSSAEQAISLNVAIDAKITEIAVYKGYLLGLIKEKKWWKGKAESFGQFLNDPALNKVGQSQSEKYMRIYEHYIKKIGLSPKELSGVSLDALDAGRRVIGSRMEYELDKEILQDRPNGIRESIREKTGDYEPNENKISMWVATWNSFTNLEQEMALKKSKLNHFTHQAKCSNPKCNNLLNLQHDHIIKKSQGGDDSMGNLRYLCESCHRLRHDGHLDCDGFENNS